MGLVFSLPGGLRGGLFSLREGLTEGLVSLLSGGLSGELDLWLLVCLPWRLTEGLLTRLSGGLRGGLFPCLLGTHGLGLLSPWRKGLQVGLGLALPVVPREGLLPVE